jgi:hypothetical protein
MDGALSLSQQLLYGVFYMQLLLLLLRTGIHQLSNKLQRTEAAIRRAVSKQEAV